jgi:hypothetical protein
MRAELNPPFQRYLDPVIEEFTSGDYYREVYDAKEEYFEKAGRVYEDDSEFEERMQLFMDWYIFDRDLRGVDLSPIRFYYRRNKEHLSESDSQIYRELCQTIHSIYRLKRKAFFGGGFLVTDLFTKKTYRVYDSHLERGFNAGDLFEGRLITFQGKQYFSKGFCFHPVEMQKFILGEIKKVRAQDVTRQNKLILQFSAMKLKHMRYQHISIEHIYTFDSRF